MSPKVSIVTAYRNRKEIFKRVLQSIRASVVKDLEVVAVDDASADEHRIEDLKDEFPFLKVYRVEPEQHKWINPSVPFNMAIDRAEGEYIMLQSAECMHIGDVLRYNLEHFPLAHNKYRGIGCYSLDKPTTDRVATVPVHSDNYYDALLKAIGPLVNKSVDEGKLSWYQHLTYRPNFYHFSTMIHRDAMKELNGFDERFADGHCFDDDNFVDRVQKLGLELEGLDFPFTAHQYHYDLSKQYDKRTTLEVLPLYAKNEALWRERKAVPEWRATRLYSV